MSIENYEKIAKNAEDVDSQNYLNEMKSVVKHRDLNLKRMPTEEANRLGRIQLEEAGLRHLQRLAKRRQFQQFKLNEIRDEFEKHHGQRTGQDLSTFIETEKTRHRAKSTKELVREANDITMMPPEILAAESVHTLHTLTAELRDRGESTTADSLRNFLGVRDIDQENHGWKHTPEAKKLQAEIDRLDRVKVNHLAVAGAGQISIQEIIGEDWVKAGEETARGLALQAHAERSRQKRRMKQAIDAAVQDAVGKLENEPSRGKKKPEPAESEAEA